MNSSCAHIGEISGVTVTFYILGGFCVKVV